MSLDPRYTLRCLREDIGVEPPALPATLDDIDDELLNAARLMYQTDERPTERVAAIKDIVLLKCKPNIPMRAAVWEDLADHGRPWLVAAGKRENGSRDDFYEDLGRRCQERRKRLNEQRQELTGKPTYSTHLLPVDDDKIRLRLDTAQKALTQARAAVSELVGRARHAPGQPIAGHAFGADIEVLVLRNDLDEIYLAIRVVGPGPANVHNVILDLAVPGLDAKDWTPVDLSKDAPPGLPGVRPGEIIWYTLLEVPRLGI